MSKKKEWDPNDYDVKAAIFDTMRGISVDFDDNGFVEKIKENADGSLHVDWYGPSNSAKKHWHFVFDVDSDGKIVKGSGRMVHD